MRVKRKGELGFYVGRRYGDFVRLHRQLRTELPGKVLPPLPKKNKSDTAAASLMSRMTDGADDSDGSSVSSVSTIAPGSQNGGFAESMKTLTVRDHRRNKSVASNRTSPRPSLETSASRALSPKIDVSCLLLGPVLVHPKQGRDEG